MEMPELSSNEATKAPEEQTLAQAATEQESHAAETDIDPEAQAEAEMTEAIEEQQADEAPATKASLLERAKALLGKRPQTEVYRDEITRLRQQFGAIRKIEIEADRAKWAEEGNAPRGLRSGCRHRRSRLQRNHHRNTRQEKRPRRRSGGSPPQNSSRKTP